MFLFGIPLFHLILPALLCHFGSPDCYFLVSCYSHYLLWLFFVPCIPALFVISAFHSLVHSCILGYSRIPLRHSHFSVIPVLFIIPSFYIIRALYVISALFTSFPRSLRHSRALYVIPAKAGIQK